LNNRNSAFILLNQLIVLIKNLGLASALPLLVDYFHIVVFDLVLMRQRKIQVTILFPDHLAGPKQTATINYFHSEESKVSPAQIEFH
jgi:hypothetical protein